jgi:hypothetical protein
VAEPRDLLTESGLRARIRSLRLSRLGDALAERGEEPAPSPREISPELVLVDPVLAAWARERC